MKHVIAWLACRSGATMVEYGLLAGGISLTIVATVIIFGSDLRGVFESLHTELSTNVAGSLASSAGG